MPSKHNYTETLRQTSFERGAERLRYGYSNVIVSNKQQNEIFMSVRNFSTPS
jgi:hypothetical protein